jgi:MoxR-like ATPase
MGYPEAADERRIVMAQDQSHPIDALEPVAGLSDFKEMGEGARKVHTDPSVMDYLIRLVRATRQRDDLVLGASPRASLGLHHVARALAYIQGSTFVRPDHIKRAAPAVLRHRLILTPQARLSATLPDQIIDALLEEVKVPIFVDS